MSRFFYLLHFIFPTQSTYSVKLTFFSGQLHGDYLWRLFGIHIDLQGFFIRSVQRSVIQEKGHSDLWISTFGFIVLVNLGVHWHLPHRNMKCSPRADQRVVQHCSKSRSSKSLVNLSFSFRQSGLNNQFRVKRTLLFRQLYMTLPCSYQKIQWHACEHQAAELVSQWNYLVTNSGVQSTLSLSDV